MQKLDTDLVTKNLFCQFIILSTRGCQWKMLMPWTHKTSNTTIIDWIFVLVTYKNQLTRAHTHTHTKKSCLRLTAGRFYHFWQSNVQKKAFDGSSFTARLITIYTYCVIRCNVYRTCIGLHEFIGSQKKERQHSAKKPPARRGPIQS